MSDVLFNLDHVDTVIQVARCTTGEPISVESPCRDDYGWIGSIGIGPELRPIDSPPIQLYKTNTTKQCYRRRP